jgi:AraC family transcriptional regulator
MGIARCAEAEYRRRVCLAMDYISANLGEELRLEDVAGAASFSRFHFHRIFKAVVGETVAEFTWRLRLESAANRLLSRRGESISRVAMDCGFSSSQNFAKAFRGRFGTSPSAFRKGALASRFSKQGNAVLAGMPYDAGQPPGRSGFGARDRGARVELVDMPERSAAYLRAMGYSGADMAGAFAELATWAGKKGYLGPDTVAGTLYWDNPEVTSEADCRMDAFLSVPRGAAGEGAIGIETIRGGPYAVCSFETGPEGFRRSWEETFALVVAGGWETADSPCYERYSGNGAASPGGAWAYDICVPLEEDE